MISREYHNLIPLDQLTTQSMTHENIDFSHPISHRLRDNTSVEALINQYICKLKTLVLYYYYFFKNIFTSINILKKSMIIIIIIYIMQNEKSNLNIDLIRRLAASLMIISRKILKSIPIIKVNVNKYEL